METRRREFLQQISGVTALAASGSLLGRDTRARLSQDVSSAETQTIGVSGILARAIRDTRRTGQWESSGLPRERSHDPTSSGGHRRTLELLPAG